MAQSPNPSTAAEGEVAGAPAAQGASVSRLDFFAAVAMHSLLATNKGISTDRLVIDSYSIARAMVARAESLSNGRSG